MTLCLPAVRTTQPNWLREPLWTRARSRPSLDLDPAGTGSLRDRVSGQNLITFTRASDATYVDSRGIIQTATTDAPRITHDPTTGKCLGLLVEESRTNLLRWSEVFDNASWFTTRTLPFGSGSVANTTVAPDGTLTADKVVEDATINNNHIIYQKSLGLPSSLYSFSVYAKAAERSQLVLRLDAGGGGGQRSVSFDLSTEAILDESAGTKGSITPVGNGWYRCVNTLTTPYTLTNAVFMLSVSGTAFYTGDGTSGIYLWGAQLEAGAFPTSYLKTEAAQSTRAADIAPITGSNFSSWYRQDEGSLYTDTTNRETFPGVNVFPYILQIDDGTNNNRLSHESSVLSGGYRYNLPVASGGVAQGVLNQSGFASGSARWASAFRTNDFAIALSLSPGVVSTRASGTLPNVMIRMQIGAGAATQFTGTIARLTYWPRRLSDPTLQELTR
jgi:hypothetical protein